jgi:tight adherence protein B
MIFVAILCGGLVFLMFLVFIEYSVHSRSYVAIRMRHYVKGDMEVEIAEKKEQLGEKMMKLVRTVAASLQKIKRADALDLKMQQAGLPLLGSEFLVLMCVSGVGAAVLVMLLTLQLPTALLLGAAAMAACCFYLNIRIARRRQAFTNQLGDTLDMVANAMRSGFSFIQAMELISREMEPPIGTEFNKVMAEIRLGATTENALLGMSKRVDSSDFDLVVTAVLIQKQVGGNLAQILDTISTTINERIKMKREVMTLTSQGRMSGWILAMLPFAVAGMLSVINPGYLQPLINEPTGRMCIAGALCLEVIGLIVIKQIVDIDV